MRALNLAFWREEEDSAETEARIEYLGSAPAAGVQTERRVTPRIMTAATAGRVAVTVALTVFAGPPYDGCARIGSTRLEQIQALQVTQGGAGRGRAPQDNTPTLRG